MFAFEIKHAPITIDTLFKPDTKPLEVLNPIVQRELHKRGKKVPDPQSPLRGCGFARTPAILWSALPFWQKQLLMGPPVEMLATCHLNRSSMSRWWVEVLPVFRRL